MVDVTSTTEQIIEALRTAHEDDLSKLDLVRLCSISIQRIQHYRQLWLDALDDIEVYAKADYERKLRDTFGNKQDL